MAWDEIRDRVVAEISEGIEALEDKVDIYRGEFEEGSEWNPVFPSAFVRPENIGKFTPHPDGSTALKQCSYLIYVADRDDCAGLAESIYDMFDGAEMVIDDGEDPPVVSSRHECTSELVTLVGWRHSVDVYMVRINVYSN